MSHHNTSSGNATMETNLTFFKNVMYVFVTLAILIFILGTAGNLATILTLRRKNLRNTSTSIYLTAFATADGFYILWAVLPKILQDLTIFPTEYRELNDVWCRVHVFAVYTATYISIWLLVAVTVDRAVQVVIPFRARELSTPRNAKIIILSITLTFIILNSHQLLTFQLTRLKSGGNICTSDNLFNTTVLPWSDLFISAFIPFFLMMVSSVFIMTKLRIVRNVRKSTLANSGSVRSGRRESASVTTMLLATNLFFITTVSPFLVFNILTRINYITNEIKHEMLTTKKSETDTFAYRKYYVIQSFSVLLWYLNFSIHFLLYCFSGKRFRMEAIALFGCERWLQSKFVNGYQVTTVDAESQMRCTKKSCCPNENSRRVHLRVQDAIVENDHCAGDVLPMQTKLELQLVEAADKLPITTLAHVTDCLDEVSEPTASHRLLNQETEKDDECEMEGDKTD